MNAPNGRKEPPRHLFLFIDGTWVAASQTKADQTRSNIYALNLALNTHNSRGEAQIAFYIPGVGSQARGLSRVLQGAFASTLPVDVENAYVNISSNYNPPSEEAEGDRVYVFGFSRGAVVARLVAGLIAHYGLLHPSRIDRFGEIWRDYLNQSGPIADERRSAFKDVSYDTNIEFLGVFDTVFGRYTERKDEALQSIFFNDRVLPARIKRAVQFLALDEARRDYRPVLWSGCEQVMAQSLEQIWMPGAHTDVGGGYLSGALGDVARLSMIDRISSACPDLSFDPSYLSNLDSQILRHKHDESFVIHSEANMAWRMLGLGRRAPGLDANEFMHPICSFLSQSRVYDRSRSAAQKLPYTCHTRLQHPNPFLFPSLNA